MTDTKPIRHTEIPWDYYVTRPEAGGDGTICVYGKKQSHIAMLDVYPNSEDDAKLICLAPTAPHHCTDAACPSNKNRLKIEAFDFICNSWDNKDPGSGGFLRQVIRALNYYKNEAAND